MDNVDFLKEIEQEFLNSKYERVIDLWNPVKNDIKINYNKEADIQLIETIASSYIYEGKYREALLLIENVLDFFELNEQPDKTADSDYSAFYNLKTEIYYYKKQYFKVYSLITNYLKSGGIVEVFPKIQIEVEDKIANNIMKFIILCLTLFSIPTIISLYNYFVNGNTIPNNFATVGVFVTGLLLIFYRLTKQSIIKIIRKTYGVV